MKFRHLGVVLTVLESGFYSIANLVVGLYFLFTENYGAGYLYSCSLSLGLLSIAFIRTPFLIEYSLGRKSFRFCIKGAFAPFFLTAPFGVLLIWLFYSADLFGVLFVMIVAFYIYVHEISRYLITGPSKIAVSVVPVVFSFVCIYLAVVKELALLPISILALVLTVIEVFILANIYNKSNSDTGGVWDGFELSNLKIVFSMSSLVHFPFLYSGFFGGAEVANKLFALRSMFQGVQVVLRAFELKIIDYFKSNSSAIHVLVGVGCAFVISLIVGVMSVFFYYYAVSLFVSKSFPFDIGELICWLLVFSFISGSRIMEFVAIQSRERFLINRSYALGGAIALIGIVSSSFFHDAIFVQSFFVCIAWFFVVVYMMFFRFKFFPR